MNKTIINKVTIIYNYVYNKEKKVKKSIKKYKKELKIEGGGEKFFKM